LGSGPDIITALTIFDKPIDEEELMKESKVQEIASTVRLEHKPFNDEKSKNQLDDSMTCENLKDVNSLNISVMSKRPEDNQPKVLSHNIN